MIKQKNEGIAMYGMLMITKMNIETTFTNEITAMLPIKPSIISMIVVSFENLVRILPIGFASKNTDGARKSFHTILSWILIAEMNEDV